MLHFIVYDLQVGVVAKNLFRISRMLIWSFTLAITAFVKVEVVMVVGSIHGPSRLRDMLYNDF